MMMNPQMMQDMMNNNQMRSMMGMKSIMNQNWMMMNPQMMQGMVNQMFNDPQVMQQMHNMMMNNPWNMKGMMSSITGPMMEQIMNDPKLRQQMIDTMMMNPQMMKDMMENPRVMDMLNSNMMERGDVAMGFDQTKIMHYFASTTTGGEIRIVALDKSDTKTISEIRSHVADIQYEFSQGNFSKPFFIHAQVVPGTKIMNEKKDLIQYSTRQIEGGAILVLTTNDSETLDAIAQFLEFQSSQHMGH